MLLDHSWAFITNYCLYVCYKYIQTLIHAGSMLLSSYVQKVLKYVLKSENYNRFHVSSSFHFVCLVVFMFVESWKWDLCGKFQTCHICHLIILNYAVKSKKNLKKSINERYMRIFLVWSYFLVYAIF